MLFDAKLAELQRQLAFVTRECDRCRQGAHPNLDARLQLRLTWLAALEQQAASIAARLALYRASANPALDTWRQLFKDIRSLNDAVQWLRTKELPAYLAATPDDHYLANLYEAVHREGGIADVYPVVSLHQTHWFATYADPPSHPLYYAPASLVTDPGELALAFHEVGHTLYRLWAPAFGNQVGAVVAATLRRKALEAQGHADPAVRADRAQALLEWQRLAFGELDEVVSDLVGVLLGGPAFAVATGVGLLAAAVNPFERYSQRYPPLDCRLRINGVALRRRNQADASLAAIDAGWDQVKALYAADRWYTWLYDDQYLDDLAAAVESFLTTRGARLYAPGCGGVRDELVTGATLLMSDQAAYQRWSNTLVASLRRDYAP